MSFTLLDDNVIIYCILPFLNFKDRFLLFTVNKHFYFLCKIYRYFCKENNYTIYSYFISSFKNNLITNDFLLNNCIFGNLGQYFYNQNLENGIYYYSKSIYYTELDSNFSIILNLYNHSIYLLIFVYNKKHKTHIIKKYTDYMIEYTIPYINLNYNEKIIKLY